MKLIEDLGDDSNEDNFSDGSWPGNHVFPINETDRSIVLNLSDQQQQMEVLPIAEVKLVKDHASSNNESHLDKQSFTVSERLVAGVEIRVLDKMFDGYTLQEILSRPLIKQSEEYPRSLNA